MPRRYQDQLADLTFSIELWFPDDIAIEQVLARCAKLTHAFILFDEIRPEYPNRILRIRQRARVIREKFPKSRPG